MILLGEGNVISNQESLKLTSGLMWIDSYIYIQYTADLQQDMEGTWGLFVFPLSQGFNKISWRAMWFFDNALKDLIKFANSDSKV